MNKIVKRAWLFCGWGAAVLMAVLFFVQLVFWGGIVWINSDSGQKFIQNALGVQLEQSGYRVEIGGFSYIFPTLGRFGTVSLYQGDKLLLSARSINIDLDISPIKNKTLGLNLNIGEMTLYPLEHGNKSQIPSTFPVVIKPFDLPDIHFTHFELSDIVIGKLIIKGEKDIIVSPKISGSIIFKNKHIVTSEITYIDRLKDSADYMPRSIYISAQFNTKQALLEIEKIDINSPLYVVNTKVEAIFREDGEIRADTNAHIKNIANLSPLSVSIKAKNAAGFLANAIVKGRYFEKDIAVKTTLSFYGSTMVFKDIKITAPDVTVSGDVTYDTTLSAIKIDLASQGYTNRGLNVELKDIRLDAALVNRVLTVNSLSMRDKENGKFYGSGTLDLADQSVKFSIKADKLHALKGDIADGIIGADINISGNSEHYKISGIIRPEKVEIKIPERFSGGIPQLHIENKGKRKTPKLQVLGKNIELNLVVDAPRQILVRGWGLDAEFGGKLEIKGRANDPKFYGDFNMLRGRYSEFGKKFKLAKAKMKFSGRVPPSPVLDILTETKAGDVIAMVAIKGSVMKPKIRFSSKPPLPQDEVVAKILFGEDMAEISPFQAVQLAQTMQRFSGGSVGGGASAFDPVGSIKSATGLDDLRLETDNKGAATVGAGKYLSEKVYLELETGSEEDSGNANIQVELTPNITLESEIGQDARGGAGIFWKWDY